MLKFRVASFSRKYSKIRTKKLNCRQSELENIIKEFEMSGNTLTCSDVDYLNAKDELNVIFENKSRGAMLRSKAEYIDKGEKPTKFFLNLEKSRGAANTINKLHVYSGDEIREISKQNEVLGHIKHFYSITFSCSQSKSQNECVSFLDRVNLAKISSSDKIELDKPLTIDEMTNALKNMENSKSPGNDGLTVEFYKFFWIDLKHLLFNSFLESEITKCLSASQKQAVIKLLTKKDKDKRFIENWRPISLLNIDTKILSKVLANRLKPTLPSIIVHDQTAYVHNRFIGESVRLVSDIIEMTDILNIEGYLVTADIQKAFDSLDHNFLLATLSKFNFGKNFINWIKIILNGQESCVFNGGFSTGYFPLQRGCRQGDQISAYLFILAFKVLLEMIRTNKEIK